MEKAIEIKRRAQRCVQNGDLDGALREYEKLVETPESDPYNFVLLADLLFKKGDQGRAAERYLNAVTAYERAGLFKNAIAVCKKMMRLSLSQAQVLRHLAELHALDGLTSEASIYFSQYAEHMVRANNATEATVALRKAFDNGRENVKLLEQLSEVLLLEGETVKAALALREAASHWRTRRQEIEALRCDARAKQLDPAGATSVAASGADPAAAMAPPPLPAASTPATFAAAPAAALVSPRALEIEHTPTAPAQFEFTRELPSEPGSALGPPAGAGLRDSGFMVRAGASLPPAESGLFERSPQFFAPVGATPEFIATPPVPEPGELDGESDEEEATPEAGVYEIAPDEETNYERALSAAEDAVPLVSSFDATPVPSDHPSLIARRPEGLLDGVMLVEHLLQRAQDEFRAGDRVKASQALLEAAATYGKLGRLDSAATILRSLGRGANSPLEVMNLWLANCEQRNDRTEGSQVACELGDRALNDGQAAQARGWFEHASAIDPTNETARRRLLRLNEPATGKSRPAPAGSRPEAGRVEVAMGRGQAMSFDLPGLLHEFQRGVEAQLDGDAQGHYDLGMAYREMGLHEQAIQAFHIAAREPRLAWRAHEMIGRCLADGGAHDDAVQEFTAALGRSPLDGAGEAELRFQLGLSLAALGDLAGAAQQLEIAEMRDPGRTDVAERLAEWRRTFGKAA